MSGWVFHAPFIERPVLCGLGTKQKIAEIKNDVKNVQNPGRNVADEAVNWWWSHLNSTHYDYTKKKHRKRVSMSLSKTIYRLRLGREEPLLWSSKKQGFARCVPAAMIVILKP